MSEYLQLPRWVIDCPRLDRSDLSIYVAMLYFADGRKRVCNPTIKELMTVARYNNERTVLRAIKNLEEAGCIEVDRRAGFPNVYYLPKSK